MNTIKKICNQVIAKSISKFSTSIAYTSTKACITLDGLEEPKMPQVLLKKAK